MSLDYDRIGRNHGASSPFKVMLGLVFTVKAGISSNLFKDAWVSVHCEAKLNQ
jgi:hypothetical protein